MVKPVKIEKNRETSARDRKRAASGEKGEDQCFKQEVVHSV